MNEDRRRYRKIYVRLWRNPDFRKFRSDDKVMTMYLLSGPQTNRLGLYHVNAGGAADDLGWTLKKIRKHREHVCATFNWSFDEAANVIFIPSWWDFNDVRENLKVLQGALADLTEVPSSPLITSFLTNLQYIPSTLHYLFEGLSRKRAIPESKPISGTQEQEQEKEQEQEQEGSSAVAEPSLLNFPTIGVNGKTWPLTNPQVQLWVVAYPSLDILAEARKALAWLQANPGRRKTYGGMPAFLVNWLNRSANFSRGPQPITKVAAAAGAVGRRGMVPDDEPL